MIPHAHRLTALAATAALAAGVVAGTSSTPGTPGGQPTAGVGVPGAEQAVAHVPPGVAASGTHDAAPAAAAGPARARQVRQQDEAAPAPARTEDPTPSGSGRQVIDRERRGQDALRAIGSQLDDVAARNRISTQQLTETLAEDDTAWVSRQGRMYFREPMPATVDGPVAGTVTSTNVDTTRTFGLHSRPGATRSIVIDADGASVTGTGWNLRTEHTMTARTWPGWDSDGVPGSFSAAEHAWIQEVWRQVSETFSAFDVDVTTDSRDDAVWKKSSDSDTTWGTRVVLTSDPAASQQACNSLCIGQAYLSTFGRTDAEAVYQPAWVFADDRSLSPVIAAQTVSHEVGHTFGLRHDGKGTDAYHEGTETWGPIMGAAMLRAVSHWSRGEYTGATNLEDDVAKIAALAPRVADDVGDSSTTASALPAATAYDVDGLIGTSSDRDVYRLDLSCSTTVRAVATGIGEQAALDLRLDLLDGAGAQLATDQPLTSLLRYPIRSTGMDASVEVALDPGVYYLRIDGVGTGTASGTGWSDYGSLGRYRLQASGCPAGTEPTPSPTATPTPTAESPSPTPTTSPTPVPTRPGAPTIGTASSGARGGTISATARWAAPTLTGGQPILGYRVRAKRLDSSNRVLATYAAPGISASARSLVWRLPRGRYTFEVQARNVVGSSAWSARSGIVTAR